MYEIEKEKLKKQYEKLQKLQEEINKKRENIYHLQDQIETLGSLRDERKITIIGMAAQIALDAVVVSLMFYMLPTFMRATPQIGTIMRNAYIAGYGALTVLGIKDVMLTQLKYSKVATPEILLLEKRQDELIQENERLLEQRIDLEISQEQIAEDLQVIEMQNELGLKDPSTFNIQIPELEETANLETFINEYLNDQQGICETDEKKLSKIYPKK